MAIIQGNAKGGASGFYPKELEQSLRFNDDDSAYLSWTPSSAGNRKTWTWSGWVKRGNLGINATLFFAGVDGGNSGGLAFNTSDQISAFEYSGTYDFRFTTTQVFRDTSAWYHIVYCLDTSNATSTERVRLYVNGERITAFSTETYPALNYSTDVNNTVIHGIGARAHGPILFNDGYLSEVHFVDGQALDATSFGEFKNGVWVPKDVDVTYGTNGFYLPFRNDYTVEGMSTVTYRGNGSDQYIGGVGFSPDLVWTKRRDAANSHYVFDILRGNNSLNTDATGGDNPISGFSLGDPDGFTLTSSGAFNASGGSYVAWCWDAGTGSPASNTDGSITSTVKANPAYGFSVVGYNTGSGTQTIGHGLGQTPDMIITKSRTSALNWAVWHSSLGSDDEVLRLNTTDASVTSSGYWGTIGSSTFGAATGNWNASGDMIAYCFNSVSGYSDFGSYTGTGASGNTITTGFKPAFVMVKRTDSADDWAMFDSTRGPYAGSTPFLVANSSAVESTYQTLDFDDTGFTLTNTDGKVNGSGATYIYMAFADTREAAFWLDDSGNNNDWENNNLTESDIVLDSPTNNFATLNPLELGTDSTYSEGNLRHALSSSTSNNETALSSFATSSGKWYAEFTSVDTSTGSMIGIADVTYPRTGVPFAVSSGYFYQINGNKVTNGAGSSYGSSWTTGDIIGVALDLDAGQITFYKNGASQGTAFTGVSGEKMVSITTGDSSGTQTFIANFGQDSSFAGNKIPQGNTDANGLGDFYYAPPAGYLALCTSNLPAPSIADGSEHFNTVLYTGDGTSSRTISADLSPDLTWIKVRNTTYDHMLIDSVRGTGNYIASSSTNAENWAGNIFPNSTPTTNGFIVDGHLNNSINGSGSTYVAWNWKANGSGVSNTDGSITSTVSANTDAGFSIVSYTGNNTAGATIGHGLDQAPEMVITKDRDATQYWIVQHKDLSAVTYNLYLQRTDSQQLDSQYTAISNTTLTVSNASVNTSGNKYISYCFHSVDGFSKFGSYTGNGSTDGPFVYTGFRPAFVLIKRTNSAASWHMTDSIRSTYNHIDNVLQPNSSSAETTSSVWGDMFDYTSNGFKLRTSDAGFNGSGDTFIYMAFAEIPVKYSGSMAR